MVETDWAVRGSVDGGKMAVMFNRFPNPFLGEPAGIQRTVVGEGTHFKIPWLQDPKVFDVRTRPRAIPTVTGTKDLQVWSAPCPLVLHPSLLEQQIGFMPSVFPRHLPHECEAF
jgi:hypothetical protein